jgi:hypothetical protein
MRQRDTTWERLTFPTAHMDFSNKYNKSVKEKEEKKQGYG